MISTPIFHTSILLAEGLSLHSSFSCTSLCYSFVNGAAVIESPCHFRDFQFESYTIHCSKLESGTRLIADAKPERNEAVFLFKILLSVPFWESSAFMPNHQLSNAMRDGNNWISNHPILALHFREMIAECAFHTTKGETEACDYHPLVCKLPGSQLSFYFLKGIIQVLFKLSI